MWTQAIIEETKLRRVLEACTECAMYVIFEKWFYCEKVEKYIFISWVLKEIVGLNASKKHLFWCLF